MTLYQKFLDALNLEKHSPLENKEYPVQSEDFNSKKTEYDKIKSSSFFSMPLIQEPTLPVTQIPVVQISENQTSESDIPLDEGQNTVLGEDNVPKERSHEKPKTIHEEQIDHKELVESHVETNEAEQTAEIPSDNISSKNSSDEIEIEIETEPPVHSENDKDTSVDTDSENEDSNKEVLPYQSQRLIIKGLNMRFIDIAREIILQGSINRIPLMREYHIFENELHEIVTQIQDAKILDADLNVQMKPDEFERFIDIYEPSLFDCTHTIFDKDIFLCIGEIIFENGVNDVYDCLPADEIIDYLNIMENLKIISYNKLINQYDILVDKEKFYIICECIPASFSNSNYEKSETDYKDVNFDDLSGTEFERYCAYILTNYNYKQIKITPSTGDHGIDILAEKDDITYAIQCKRYSDNVGNAAVQQAHTGKSLYHKDIAVVMTNQYFTSQAIEEAKTLGVKLWDRDKLVEMIAALQETV